MDVVTGEGEVVHPTHVLNDSQPTPPNPTDLQSAAEALRNAERPVLFAGSAVIHSDARDELQQLAEKLNASCGAVARCAKGALPEDHPLALQIVYGYPGVPSDADCGLYMLAVGPRFHIN